MESQDDETHEVTGRVAGEFTGEMKGDIVGTVIDDIEQRSTHKHARSLAVATIAGSFLLVVVLGVSTLAGVFGRTTENAEFAEAIQDERARATLQACRAQNARHQATVKTLDRVIAGLPAGPRRQEATERRDGTVALIDALVPLRNCKKLVERTVVQGKPD